MATYHSIRFDAGQSAPVQNRTREVTPKPLPRLPRVSPPASWSDSFADGTPDFLRLDSATDREAFRGWFAEIAEFQALRPASDVPAEIGDCAALLRYAYRNALRAHDAAWFAESGIEPSFAPPSVEKYHYPFTPLGADLFRIRPGPAGPGDAASQAFAQFADAATLKAFNTFFVSRDVRTARPGDLLFYRQLEQNEPFHSMVYVGSSAFPGDSPEARGATVVVYHTGEPGNAGNGMRRITLVELLGHPSPRWRPVAGNANFLGVYRWTILRETQ